MPIIHTNTFWDYLIGESPDITSKVIGLLTRKEYDFDTKQTNWAKYYNIIHKFICDDGIHKIIRFPGGLCKYISLKLNIPIQEIQSQEFLYSVDDILEIANKVQKINPTFEIREYQIDAVCSSVNRFRSLIHSCVGSGKEQPCDIIIPTPSGFKKFGDLNIGDNIFGINGKSQTVTNIFPQGIKDVYKVFFRNGATVECGLEHLWTVRKNRGALKTLSLHDIIKDGLYRLDGRGFKAFKYSVEYNKPVEYPEKKYFIHPYILGILIGDGTLTTNKIGFSCPDNEIEIINRIKENLNKDYHLFNNFNPNYHYKIKKCPQYYISLNNRHEKNLYKKYIIDLKLNVKSQNKFIPENYLLGSIEQRKELLAGLLDSDGCCRKRNKHCSISYGTVSEQLAKDIQQLVFSLGGSATIASYKRKNKNREYTVSIELLFNPFYLSRKRNNYIPYLVNNTIIDIKKIRRAECMCIKVSNTDELYLTENYIPTHNTSMLSLVCKVLKNDKILILNGNNFILQQIYERLISFGETDISWNPSKEPDYSKRIVLFNTKGSDSRLNSQDKNYINFLKEVNTIIWDEAHHVQSLTWFEPLFYTDIENLHHIIGYSGSPFREYKNPYMNGEDFRTIALLGPRAFVYEMKDTIADKNIAEPHAYFISYKNKPASMPQKFQDNYFMKYRMNIVYNKNRNQAGLEMLKFLNKYGIKTLASFNNLKPGQNLMRELKMLGIKSLFQCGDETIYEFIETKRKALKLEKRKGTPEDIKNALNNDYNIIFGSTVMDEGIDLDVFQAVVIFSAGKTSISNIQRIGRASRKRKNGRNISFVIDFKDIEGEKICEDHYYKRRQMIQDSGVKILDKVQDFMNLVKEIGEENAKMEK